MTVRVRFAPAPSGSLHVGNARTALYNWLFARRRGGVFVLRIEDTDLRRVTQESYRRVLEDLRWLGLEWDEGPEAGGAHGPYRQSERLDIYREVAGRLLRDGAAYRCYCTKEELEKREWGARAAGRPAGYDGRCARLTEAERAAFEAEGRPWTVRFRVPDEGATTFSDLVTGEVTVEHAQLEDFSLVRPDGSPLYNLAATVDDGLMEITHVIRGLDLQSSTPRQILLHRFLGNPVPRYAHLPLILGPDRQKLSKRRSDVMLAWYQENGFLPEAMVNYLAFLGWGLGRDALMSLNELAAAFSIEAVNASPAMFDVEKLTWMNGEHIRRLDDAELARRLEPWLAGAGLVGNPPSEEERARIGAATPLIKTRIERLDQAAGLLRSLFAEVQIDPGAFDKAMRQPHVPDLLKRALDALAALPEWTMAAIEEALRGIQAEMGLKPKTAFQPIRVAVTGVLVSPPLFESMELIGRERCLARLERGLQQAG